MAEELSGEHKLRIVLESILRDIPKGEQCQKYGISEDEFQGWHDHLITNGGKIFEPDFGKTRTRVRKVHQMSSLSKTLLVLSLLVNLAAMIFVAVWKLYPFDDPCGFTRTSSPATGRLGALAGQADASSQTKTSFACSGSRTSARDFFHGGELPR